MNKLYVSYELALLLKDFGFERKLGLGNNLSGYNLNREKRNITYYHVHTYFPNDNEFLYAPLYQQVTDWLWEEYEIFINFDYDRYDKVWYSWLEDIKKDINCLILNDNYKTERSTSYHVILEYAITKAIEYLKNDRKYVEKT